MASLSPNFFQFMEWEHFNLLIVEVWIVISPGHIPDIQPHIISELGNFYVFFTQSSLYISLEWHQTKVPASSPCPISICEYYIHLGA